MNRFSSLRKIHLVTTAVIIAAICIFVWQPAPLAIPAEDNVLTIKAEKDHHQTITVARVKTLFDLSILPTEPAPVIAPQIIAPDASIQRYHLLGVTLNSNDAVALVSNGTNSFNLKLGDVFEGFVVSAIEARKIEFKADNIISVLELPR